MNRQPTPVSADTSSAPDRPTPARGVIPPGHRVRFSKALPHMLLATLTRASVPYWGWSHTAHRLGGLVRQDGNGQLYLSQKGVEYVQREGLA